MTEALYITQKALAARCGFKSSSAITRIRERHGDDFPLPLAGPGWPRYLLSDIEHWEKHGTRPKGRAYFGKAKQAHAPDPALSPASRDSERKPPKRQPWEPVPERPPDTLTIAELAVALGHGKRTVERLLRDNPEHLPTPLPREDWHRYWAKQDVEAWLTRHLRQP